MIKAKSFLHDAISRQKQGEPAGVFSICSANPTVIESSIKFAAKSNVPLLLESTCNQVNQFGGYMNMLPRQFAGFVWMLAEKHNLPKKNIILGGDHLGPYPWQSETVENAMHKSRDLIRSYVSTGYTKIHLDASMKCADDPPDMPLSTPTAAARSADLCAVAEVAAEQAGTIDQLVYVIGTEVPLPGGVEDEGEGPQVSKVDDVRATIRASIEAFRALELNDACDRLIAVVVQPGVEFGNRSIFHYVQGKTRRLSEFIKDDNQLVYEAHSTDYQTPGALRKLVDDQFAILKVGPELTFAYREALFSLEFVEKELLGCHTEVNASNLAGVVDAVMLRKPKHWERYYQGSVLSQAFDRKFSFSDRIRYYWADREIQSAVNQLLTNLTELEIPLTLISQFFPLQYQKVRSNTLSSKPGDLIEDKIKGVLEKYTFSCGFRVSWGNRDIILD